jgi:hypothetical protein
MWINFFALMGASRDEDREETGSLRDEKAVRVSSMLMGRLFLFSGPIPLIRPSASFSLRVREKCRRSRYASSTRRYYAGVTAKPLRFTPVLSDVEGMNPFNGNLPWRMYDEKTSEVSEPRRFVEAEMEGNQATFSIGFDEIIPRHLERSSSSALFQKAYCSAGDESLS